MTLFICLAVAALLIDALVPPAQGDWRKGAASAQDVARIVGGGKPSPEPRHGLKLGLLFVAVLVLAFVFGGLNE